MNSLRNSPGNHESFLRRSLMLVFLYWLPLLALDPKVVNDPDIWWHLRAGQWIVEHGTTITTDPFSAYGIGKPWIAYSWLFEVLVFALYRMFGLVGIALYNVALAFAITIALHRLIHKLEPRFAISAVLTGLGIAAIGELLLTPRPWLFTILFFILELDIILTARRTGNWRGLLFLPPIFALWANIHVQFIYGFFVLGLATVEPLLNRLLSRSPFRNEDSLISTGRMATIMVACVVATLINPYHVGIYEVIYELVSQPGPYLFVSELKAPGFRHLSDWVALFLTLGATFALGWRKQIKPFPLLLLLAGAFVFFRAGRDIWFAAVAATMILAASPSASIERGRVITNLQILLVAAAIVSLMVITARMRQISESELQQVTAKAYPAAAADFVEKQSYVGPLYNHFDWGGYLIWRLPQLPVSMDGRTNLHGDERINRSLQTWGGHRDWVSDPELASARLVIASATGPLGSLLRLDSRFELVYEDDVAVVFVARARSGV